MPRDRLELRARPYELELRHPFTLATSSRTTTPVVLTEIAYAGVVGYGEASMPPYLGESHASVLGFLSRVDLARYNDPFRLEDIGRDVDSIAPGHCAAKACIDIALHDLVGKLLGQPWHRLWGYSKENAPVTSFTLGIDTEQAVIEKAKEASSFGLLKLKLGRTADRTIIDAVRSVRDVPLCVDVNEGWQDRHRALDMIGWLSERGVVFIEQPLPRGRLDDTAWLTERSPLPIIADEDVQRLSDVTALRGVYSGINIKLMKCGGMREAHKMLGLARGLGMKVMIGCMTETSCAISAAAQLSPAADWADLDGNLLIRNDLYEGVTVADGKITLNDLPGIGVRPV